LSGGTRQKLNLTLALPHDPDVLLLEETYQDFDWETYLRFWGSGRRLAGTPQGPSRQRQFRSDRAQ